MTCYVSSNIAAPCQQGHPQDGPVHCAGEVEKAGSMTVKYSTGFFCEKHCPVHGAQATLDWKEPAKTIAGHQEILF